MTPNQFRVFEHLSYDIIAVFLSTIDEVWNDRISIRDSRQMLDSLEFTITPSSCRVYLFPDWQFDAKEFARR